MGQLDDFAKQISLSAKTMGFKKNRLSWYKSKEKLSIIFSIQKSQYGSDSWCYVFGICLHEITNGNTQSINECQIKYRMDNIMNGKLIEVATVINILERWDSMYGDLRSLKIVAVEGKLPGQYSVRALRYLTSVNLSII